MREKINTAIKNNKGFTLAELLVAVLVASLILTIVSNIFVLNQRTFRKGNTKAELLQNTRIALDLMSREIRQAIEIVTVLPADDSVPASIAHELQFEDGHTSSRIQYIRYYLDGDQLKRQIILYYFENDDSTYVHWDDVGAFATLETVDEEKIIGEYFSNLNFYGDKIINIDLIMKKNSDQIEIKTNIYPRNA